jgi:hypothetical protein
MRRCYPFRAFPENPLPNERVLEEPEPEFVNV